MWKITLYLLFVALPMWGVTSFYGENSASITELETASAISATEETPSDGAILGSIIADESLLTIKVHNKTSEFCKVMEASGDYFIKGFQDGIYTVEIVSTNLNDERSEIFKEVEIRQGEVTALGTVAFQ